MRRKAVSKFIVISLLIFAGTIILYSLLGVIRSEGFNPSDDGVILAQSYRLLQGQVPHLDFISIRPVGSAVLHLAHFFSPLPLEISARWFVLLQYLGYSLLWVWVMVRFTSIREYRGLVFYVILGLWAFLLNQNHYNLFPWTTIDALFWMVLALAFYLPYPAGQYNKNAFLKITLTVLFASMASLSRQTFALPAIILFAGMFFHGFRLGKIKILVPAFFTGLAPFYIYFSILALNDALPLFLEQMTGRTEIFDTGIRQFFIEFWQAPAVWVYLVIIFLLLFYRLSEPVKAGTVFRLSLITLGRLAFVLMFTLTGFTVFLSPESLFAQSFVQFWLLLLLWAFEEITGNMTNQPRRWFFWILLISWTSAISLGDNAPVFSTGLLNVTGLGYILLKFSERGFSFRRLAQLQILCSLLLLLALILGLTAQKQNNYRDVTASEQLANLGEIFPEFGGIRTNTTTYSYMEEIDLLYKNLGFPKGRFVVLPNAAIIYPILESPNPMAVDWMQAPEFPGSEERLEQGIIEAIERNQIFFLIDKFDSKQLSDTLIPFEYSKEDYPYMDLIIEQTMEHKLQSSWFEVRVSK